MITAHVHLQGEGTTAERVKAILDEAEAQIRGRYLDIEEVQEIQSYIGQLGMTLRHATRPTRIEIDA